MRVTHALLIVLILHATGVAQTQETKDKLFAEETRIIHHWLGESAGDEFGWVGRIVGDVDRDSVWDCVVTAPSHAGGAGKFYVYSGRSGAELFSHRGKDGERLGNSASSAGDINGDQIPDVLIGAPKGDRAYVYSGSSGEQLLELKIDASGVQFGYKVCALGDIDGDGASDVFVSALAGDGEVAGSGAGFALSGKSGEELFRVGGERAGDKFGSAVSAAKDKDDVLLAIGAQDAGPNRRGRVYVYRVQETKPKLAFVIDGDQGSVNLGMMFVSFPGDLNRDGTIDIFAADWGANSDASGAGKIVVCSGTDGSLLLELAGSHVREGFGTSTSEAGDVNGDGIGDLVIGAWQHASGAPSGGRVTLFDGASGTQLDCWTGTRAGETFGFDAVGIGDVDGDGAVDFLLTSAWANVHGPRTGRTLVVAGKAYPVPEGDADPAQRSK